MHIILPEAQSKVRSLPFCSFVFVQSLVEIMRCDGVAHFHFTGALVFFFVVFFKGEVRCKNKRISFMPDSPLPGPPSKTRNPAKSWDLDESEWCPRKNKVARYLLRPWLGRNASFSFSFFFPVEKMRPTFIIAEEGFRGGQDEPHRRQKAHVTFRRTLTLWYCSAVNLSVQMGATGT